MNGQAVAERAPTVLLGPLSIDRYIDEGLSLPGGGALNMAWHWARSGFPFRFLSRAGDDDRTLVGRFLSDSGINAEPGLFAPGASASIDIVTRPDRQPWMDNFVEGVWSGLRLSDAEVAVLAASARLHAVLVEPVIAELERLDAEGRLSGIEVSADFLSFRHYDLSRFERTMGFVSIGFVGWPGRRDDPEVAEIGRVAMEFGKTVIVTLGSAGVVSFDGSSGIETFHTVDAVPVAGTTVGCGDAFVAAFLSTYWGGAANAATPRGAVDPRSIAIAVAVEAGKKAGAAATAWKRPLPDQAYGAPLA